MAPSSWRPLNGTGVRRIPRRKTEGKTLRLGTWNVRSLKSPEKVHNVCKEMIRLRIDILGISDVRWRGNGKYQIDEDHIMYYSGTDDTSNKYGVGIIVNTKSLNTTYSFLPNSNRTMLLQLQAKPRNINIIQVYAPTTDGTDQEVQDFYSEVEQLLKLTKKHEVNLVMGDMNAKVGNVEVQGVTGKFGLGTRNERGETFVQFCQERDLVVMNTFYQLPPRRLYTWTSPRHSPQHVIRNQIDYITINKRFRNSIKNTKTYPGADIGSDHNPLIATISCILKKIKKKTVNFKSDITKFNDTDTKAKIKVEINKWAAEIKTQAISSSEETWRSLKAKILEINKDYLKRDWSPKQAWMTEKIYKLMEERRLYKHTNVTKYKKLHRTIRREARFARESWFRHKCECLENLYKKHDAFNLHKEIKTLMGHKTHTNQLVDEHQIPILDISLKKQKWEQYITSLFYDDTRNEEVVNTTTEGYSIMPEEIIRALSKAKRGKSPGPDNINIEVLKLIEEDNIEVLVNFMNSIYDSGELPHDWLKSTFVTLPKKANAKRCEDFRTISLMSQVLKVFLSIIHERIRKKCDDQLGDSQFGFRAGVGLGEFTSTFTRFWEMDDYGRGDD
ncbi:PREDICTED: uncharacterized protein LOC106104958 [Papilio polytes]|uniref:uncharacterized protein LOC106104958 n=1 Tax=Papilio polytes TaxID=76194 RepID=UPI000675F678|nr:PREDICTED: uncharacterized protein LOC106104958 [Papilio polytes]